MKNLCFIMLMLLITTSLLAQVLINPVANLPLDQHETAIAVSPINPKYVIATWNDFQSNIKSQAGYAISSDGGNNWFKIDTLTGINRHPYRFGFDPSCGFDRYGNVYYSYCTYKFVPPNNYVHGPVYVSKSANYGASWSHYAVCTNDGNDKPFLAIDNSGGQYDGRVYVVWLDGSSIKTAYLPKDGSIFQGHQTIPGSKWGFMPVVGPNGDVFVVTRSHNPSAFRILKSTNGGVSYTVLSQIPYSFTNDTRNVSIYTLRNNPSYAIDMNSGYQYIAFSECYASVGNGILE